MNLKNVAIIVDETLTTVDCTFGPSDSSPSYKYLAKKELAKDLKEGDLVVVQRLTNGNCGYTVVRVSSVDEESDIDDSTTDKFLWLIDKVEGRAEFLQNDLEETFTKLKTMRRKSYRESLIQAYKAGTLLEE